jgi:hypothetical protein
MEPEFEVPELSLPGGVVRPTGTVRLRAEAAIRAGLDPARHYLLVDPPAGEARPRPETGVWIDDGGRPRRISPEVLERRRATRSSRP